MRNGVVYQYSVTTITGTDIHDLAGLVPAVYSHPLLDINQVAAYSVFSTETIYENTFSDLKIGFDARFSASTVRNNDFSLDTDPGSVGTTRGITVSGPEELDVRHNFIENGYKGIYVMRSFNPIRISENILERSLAAIGHTGIEVIALGTAFGQASELNDNKIEIANGYGATGISLAEIRSDLRVNRNKVFFATAGTPLSYNTGIRGYSVFGATFAYDTVTASAGYRETLFSSGIRLTNSAYNRVFCSRVNNLSRGIHLAGPSEQTRLLTNRIMEAEVGFELHGPAMMGVQVHHENQWVGDYSGLDEYGALVSGPDEEITAEESKFIVNPLSSNPGTLPDPIGPPSVTGIWFDPRLGEGPSCNFDPPVVPVLPPVDFLDAMIRKELDFNVYNEETTWLMKAGLFDLLLRHPALLDSSAVLDSFFDAEEITGLGALVTAQHLLSLRHGVQVNDKSNGLASIRSFSADIVYIDSSLALKPVDSVAIMALRALKVDSLAGVFDTWLDLLADEEAESQDVYEEVWDDLAGLALTDDIEAYLQKALIYKARLLTGDDLDSSDSTEMAGIVTLCPWEGGRAIAVAGELLLSLTDSSSLIPLEVNCTPPSPFQAILPPGGQAVTLSPGELEVYPNPVQDVVSVKATTTVSEVTITGLRGEKYDRFRPNDRHFTLHLGHLPNGIYLISVETEEGSTTKRISILR